MLVFGEGSKLKVEEYTESDFMTDVDDRKSILGCIFIGNEVQLTERVLSN